jgi:hypothetical protein
MVYSSNLVAVLEGLPPQRFQLTNCAACRSVEQLLFFVYEVDRLSRTVD